MKGLPNMVAGQYGTAYLVSWDEEKCGEERRALNGSASSASSAFARPIKTRHRLMAVTVTGF